MTFVRKTEIEAEHVKAHRTEKERQQMSLCEKFVTEGNEKADELATEVAMLDGGFMAQVRAKMVQQERRSARSLAVGCQFSLFGGTMERLRRA